MKLFKAMAAAAVVLTAAQTTFPDAAESSVLYLPEKGVSALCNDGRAVSAFVFPGRGYLLTKANGTQGSAYPLGRPSAMKLTYQPTCRKESISPGSAQQMINSWNKYCIREQRYACRYEQINDNHWVQCKRLDYGLGIDLIIED